MELPTERPHPHLLLLDDEPFVLELATEVLRLVGEQLTYEAFAWPHPAVARFEAAPLDFDVVVTGYCMPEMMGPEVVRRVRAACPTIPIVVWSGGSEESVRLHITEDVHYLKKPFTAKELLAALGSAANVELASSQG